jgi:hexokinase
MFIYRFEKMISGMYMGEIVRLVLVKLAQDGHIFDGEVTEDLDTRERFYTKYVSEIER